MKLAMVVEPHGWARLELAAPQATIILRVSYMSDVLTNILDVLAQVAGGADAAETILGLEPGDASVSLRRDIPGWSALELRITDNWRVTGGTVFHVETSGIARLGLDLASTVDRDAYLESFGPQASWPDEALERLRQLADADGAGRR